MRDFSSQLPQKINLCCVIHMSVSKKNPKSWTFEIQNFTTKYTVYSQLPLDTIYNYWKQIGTLFYFLKIHFRLALKMKILYNLFTIQNL